MKKDLRLEVFEGLYNTLNLRSGIIANYIDIIENVQVMVLDSSSFMEKQEIINTIADAHFNMVKAFATMEELLREGAVALSKLRTEAHFANVLSDAPSYELFANTLEQVESIADYADGIMNEFPKGYQPIMSFLNQATEDALNGEQQVINFEEDTGKEQ